MIRLTKQQEDIGTIGTSVGGKMRIIITKHMKERQGRDSQRKIHIHDINRMCRKGLPHVMRLLMLGKLDEHGHIHMVEKSTGNNLLGAVMYREQVGTNIMITFAVVTVMNHCGFKSGEAIKVDI